MSTLVIPEGFEALLFAETHGLGEYDFRSVGGVLVCPSLPDLTPDDLLAFVLIPDIWGEVRNTRDSLLNACDWTQLPDAALTAFELGDWQIYRQVLRNVPQSYSTPNDVVWPEAPNHE